MSNEPFNFNKLDRPGRPTNKQLCLAFRNLLTESFKVRVPEMTDHLSCMSHSVDDELFIEATKPWRGELWKAFREIEDRLCPLDAMERARNGKR